MIIHYASLDSTQNYIKKHLLELNDLDFVWTNEQTSGRGRTGHTWESQSNENLMFSFFIKNKTIINNFNIFSIAIGVIIKEFLENSYHIHDVLLKWPNDVLVNGKKIAGILMEGSFPNYLIVGVGINVNQTNFNLLNATSIKLETNTDSNIENMMSMLEKEIQKSCSAFNHKKKSYIAKFNKHNYLKNAEITYSQNNALETGVALKINNSGALIIKNKDKKIFPVFADEVSLIRKK